MSEKDPIASLNSLLTASGDNSLFLRSLVPASPVWRRQNYNSSHNDYDFEYNKIAFAYTERNPHHSRRASCRCNYLLLLDEKNNEGSDGFFWFALASILNTSPIIVLKFLINVECHPAISSVWQWLELIALIAVIHACTPTKDERYYKSCTSLLGN